MTLETQDTGTADDIMAITDEDTTDTSADTTVDTTDEPAETVAEVVEEMFELKADGKTEKITKAELLKRAAHATSAARTHTEATRLKNDASRLLDMLKSNPLAALKEIDSTFDQKKFLTTKLAEIMEDELASPEERQQRQELAELQEYRRQKQDEATRKQQAEMDALTASTQQELDETIGAAMKVAGLPRTPGAVKRIAAYMLEAAEEGLSVPVDRIAAQVKLDIKAEISELLSVSDDESFEALLGSDLLTKAQKVQIKKVKRPGNSVAPTVQTNRESAEKPMSTTDFLRANGIR